MFLQHLITLDTSMEVLKSASLGAMGSLLRKLDELAHTEDRVRQLRDDLGSINIKLVKLSGVNNSSLTVNYWMKDVRELSYDMEDCVDQLIHADDTDTKMDWIDNLLGFKTRVAEARERYNRFNLEYGLSHHTTSHNHHFRIVTREPSTVIPVDPVGMEGQENKLRRLVEPKSDDENGLKLKVVSILGVEGVGKTMLSKKLWGQMGGLFECQAFVQTAKKPDIRMILRNIFSQIYLQQPPQACQVPHLIHDIKKHLKDKRYFIVIEDLWAVSVWDTLSRCFPEGNRCSRIMTTTTIEDVALGCCSYDPEHIFRMRPLSAEHSNQLFIKRIFGTGEGCPQQFIDISDDITRKCGGLPLAIICIASLVARQRESVEQWRHVQKILSHNLISNSSAEVLKQVLKLCYNSLPHSLKTCLLYLSVYPENYLILKDDLLKQWIAEDFICAKEEKDILEVASSYFDDLLGLGLIQQMATNNSKKKGLSYVVHPTVFDFITCKSMEDNFITTIDYSQSTAVLTDNIRRLCLHFGSATYATLPASIGLLRVRSLAFMGLLNCIPSLVKFRLVRIVILHLRSDDADTRFSLVEIDKLLLLRYLHVRCNVTVELPYQMKCLKHLETLRINGIVSAIPSDIAHVLRLSNVCVGGKRYHKHHTMCPVTLGKAISMDESPLQVFELLPPICIFLRLPKWILQLRKLRIVEIMVRDLHLNDIDVFSELPVLSSLSLYVRTPTAGRVVFIRSGTFPALECFRFVCGLLLLNIQKEAMPNLRRLKIGFNVNRGDKYSHMLEGIHHLLNLEEITASTGTASDAKKHDSSIAVLRDAINNHPCHPSFKVKMVDPIDEEYYHCSETQICVQEKVSSSEIQEDDSSIKHPRKLSSTVAKRQNIFVFTEDEIKIITSNFSIPIGQGVFGEVYRGILDDGYDLVAVKRYISKDLRKEFMEEVSIHSQMSHKNVVELIGYCIGENTLTIVTKYISKGNLDDILHNSETLIPLDVRMGIAIGCAEALSYIHSMHLSNDSLLCHGDIKPSNILLDANLTAKLSDFGVSRLLSGGVSQYTVHIKGSLPYMDPIYFHEGQLTPKSDVYSFGIVLLELITGKKLKRGEDINLIGAFNKAYPKGKGLMQLFDAAIANENNMKILKEMRKLAAACLTLDIHKRPDMNVLAKRLQILKKELKHTHEKYSEPILASHHSWHKNYKHDITMPSYNSRMQLKKSSGIFKRNHSNSKTVLELQNVRIFTTEELNDVTNYSYLLSGGTSGKVYKGTLADNTVVAVRIFSEVLEGFEEAFLNGGMILSQIVHKNIIKLLGCCLDADCPAFVYEYAAKGSLSDILDGNEDFPLHLRVKIAIQTAEALEYLHSSATGIIRHGYVVPSKILLDDNFTPKLTGFTWALRVIKESNNTASDDVICSQLPSSGLNNEPTRDQNGLLRLKTDVYQFGVVLLTLISRKNFIVYSDHDHLISQFLAAYKTDNRGRAFFDDDIAVQAEDIALLEEIGRLSLKCICLEIDQRPTMKEVAEHLRILRISWKNIFSAKGSRC